MWVTSSLLCATGSASEKLTWAQLNSALAEPVAHKSTRIINRAFKKKHAERQNSRREIIHFVQNDRELFFYSVLGFFDDTRQRNGVLAVFIGL